MTEAHPAPSTTVHSLFPTPIMQISGAVGAEDLAAIVSLLREASPHSNQEPDWATRSTSVERPGARLMGILDPIVLPALTRFGSLLIGEELAWRVSGIWASEVSPYSSQKLHNHANSMASGIIYAEGDFSRSKTQFLRGEQTVSYSLSNKHRGARVTEFSRDSWEPKSLAAGDLILFPSYLLHSVANQSDHARTTIAFNALPERLKYQEYEIRFF